EAVIGVDEHEAAVDPGARKLRGLEERAATLAVAQRSVIEAGPEAEARERERDGTCGPTIERRVRRREAYDRDRDEDVLDRERVAVEARAASRVVAIEVERHVREDLGSDRDAEGAAPRAGPRGVPSQKHQEREGLGVQRIDQVLLEAPER